MAKSTIRFQLKLDGEFHTLRVLQSGNGLNGTAIDSFTFKSLPDGKLDTKVANQFVEATMNMLTEPRVRASVRLGDE